MLLRGIALGALVWLASANLAQAAKIATDSFETYTLGAINGQNGGTGWTNAWVGQANSTVVDVSANPLNYAGGSISISGGTQALQILTTNHVMMVGRSFALQSDTVYFSFLFRSPTAAGTSSDFIQLWLRDIQAGAGDLPSVIHNHETGSTFRFGARSGAATTNVFGGPATNTTDTYFVVAKISKTGASTTYNRTDIFVNPTSLAEPVSDAFQAGDSTLASVLAFGIRTANLETGDTYLIDHLQVGTSWDSVVTPIPEPATLTLAALGALGLFFMARKRRRA